MNHTSQEGRTVHELRGELHKGLGLLRTLRDEIKVDLHLAGMDARVAWQTTLEPRLKEFREGLKGGRK